MDVERAHATAARTLHRQKSIGRLNASAAGWMRGTIEPGREIYLAQFNAAAIVGAASSTVVGRRDQLALKQRLCQDSALGPLASGSGYSFSGRRDIEAAR